MPNLIVSLTSYPARINGIHKTIESIINQTLKADLIILWLTKNEFINNENNIPKTLLRLVGDNFKIEWIIESYRSYNKLIPSLKKFPNDIIVTADDDVLYDKNWLKMLFDEYTKNPNYIHAQRCHKVLFKDKNHLEPYNKWNSNIKDTETKPCYTNFFTGVGGVLYPPTSLYKDTTNHKLFNKLCPFGDDIWFWTMALLNGTKINLIKNRLGHPEFNKLVSQENNLFQINFKKGFNDVQIRNVLRYYPKLMEIIKTEFKNNVSFKKFKLFNFINLLDIKKYQNYSIISIFEYIPIIKIIKKDKKTYIKLFGFIPLLKIKNI